MLLARLSLAASLLLVLAPWTGAAENRQALRVAADAREIREFRLESAHLVKLRQVAATLAREYAPRPERPRADGAIFVVLSMSLAFNEPFTARTVAEMTRTIESGHADLHAAIKGAGWSTTEYVLTHITLLLSFPVVASEREGRATLPPTDASPENVEFVRRNWSEVQAIVDELGSAARLPKP